MLYSNGLSGAQLMPNGNIFITSSFSGEILEINEDSEIVWNYVSPTIQGQEVDDQYAWEYIRPYCKKNKVEINPPDETIGEFDEIPVCGEDPLILCNSVVKVTKYSPSYAGINALLMG